MAGAVKETSIRFGVTGKAEVKQTFAEISDSGDAAAKRWSKSWERAAADADEALARQARAAEKLAAIMPKTAVQMQVEAAAGSNTRLGGGYAAAGAERLGQFEGSARASADAFRALFAEEERLERQALALRAAIDPVWGAQQRFNQEMGEARALISAGHISLDEYVAKLRQEQAALDAVSGKNDKLAASTKRTGNAFASAAPQIQDLFVQISMGSNPVNALVVQGGQLAGQLQYADGKAGAFARTLMGPWGVGFQVALLVMGPLVSKLWEQSEAEEAAKKAATEHKKAMLDLAEAQGTALRTAERKQAIDVANLKITLEGIVATRKQTQALLDQAVAQAQIDRQRASAPGQRGENASLSAVVSSDRAAGLAALLKKNDDELAAAQKGFDLGFARLVGMKVDARSTPEGRVNAQFERDKNRAMTDLAGLQNAGRLADRLRELNKARDAEIDRIQKAEAAQRAATKTAQEYGREVTSAQASAIARGAGLTVNSADRSVERQRQLYDAWVAQGKPSDNPVAKPGSSAHNRGNALDIQMSAGVTVAKIKSAFEAEGVRLTKIITERGHWHIEWARTSAQKQADKEMAKDVREAAAAHRELQSDVEGLIRLLDPARAAGDAYAQTLLTIAKAEQAGMLTQGEALGYRLTAAQQERDRRGKEMVQASTAMFGGEDPLKDLLERGQREKEQQVDLWNENRERGMESYRSVADFYLNAMNGGTNSIWSLFRQNGLRVLSELLAKWTVGQAGGGGGLMKLLGLASTAAGSFDASTIRAGANSALDALPRNATGTEYFPGGLSVVGEFGKELVSLPRGSRVTPAAETRRMLAGNDNGARGGDTHNHFTGNLMTPEFWQMIQAGDDAAAMRGAAGGSAMGQAEQRATGARRLGRRW